MPREESFPIPLKYIDVIRSTQTDLDVAQEKRIDDYWNVDGNRNLSDSWTLLNETPPEGFMWSVGRLTKIEKPKLEHARKLRRIYSIDPSDEEHMDIIIKCQAKVGDIKGSCNAMQKSVLPGMHTRNRCFKNRESQGR